MSVVILAPDGEGFADRHVEPMTADQVMWFEDPVRFLQNIPHLWALKLKVYCQRCYRRGLTDDVRVRWNDTEGAFYGSCQCRRKEGRLPMATIRKYASSTDELLRRLGWSLCCTGRCSSESGVGDGVRGENDPSHALVSICCGCTERRYVMPEMPKLAS